MRSKLIPGRIRPVSFTLPVLIIILALIFANFTFDYMTNQRLKHLENAPTSTQTALVSEDIADVDTLYLASEYERALVENVVFAEAGNQGIEGMEAVSQVILDRSVLWNMTPAEVVTQEGQFATYEGNVSEECRLAVSNVFDLGVRVFPENVTHFYSGDVVPYWTENKESRGSVGGHEFFI